MKHLILDSFHVTYVWEHLFADVCFEKYEKRRNQTSKKRDERSSVESWLWQSLIAGKRCCCCCGNRFYTDTLPEVQRSRILSRVIPQLAEFPVILPSKHKHLRVSNRIKLWSHRCFFWKRPQLESMPAKAPRTKARFSVSLLAPELFANLALNTPFTGLSTLRCAHL